MRQVLTALITILLFAPELLARDNHGWEQVEKLKPGTLVMISLWSGDAISGRVVAVSQTTVRLSASDRGDSGASHLQEVGRETIRRIIHIRRPKLPDPERWMRNGALIGGGVGLASGAIYDLTHHENYHWFTGGWLARDLASSPPVRSSQESESSKSSSYFIITVRCCTRTNEPERCSQTDPQRFRLYTRLAALWIVARPPTDR